MKIVRWRQVGQNGAFHAARTPLSRTRPLGYHGHDFAEMFWIDAGRGIHRINGQSTNLQAGSLILMRPTDCHGIDPVDDEGLKLTNIAFARTTLDFLGGRYFSEGEWAFWQGKPLPAAHQLEPYQLQHFNIWANELADSPPEPIHIERFLLNVLAELKLEQNEVPLNDAPDWLARACRLIQKNNHFPGGVREFVRLCGRGREHVSREVRRCLKTTPTAYVNGIRMSYAKRQLEMGNQEILDIALECGIGNLSHFYELFRAHTGTTPRAYRLSHRKPF